MTKIKGTACIKIYNPNVEGSERYIKASNYVTEYAYRLLYNPVSGYPGPSRSYTHFNLFIANRTGYIINKTGYNLKFTTTEGLLVVGTKPSSQTSPVAYTTDVSIPFVQFYNRIDPPSTSRTFNIIGLTVEGVGATTVYPLTILMVEPVCTQAPEEFIDVVYNLEIVKGNSYYFTNQFEKDWVNYFVSASSFDMHIPSCSYCALPRNPSQVDGYEFLNVYSLGQLSKYYQTRQYLHYNSPLKQGKYVELVPGDTNYTISAIGFVINTIFLGVGNTRNVNYNVYPYYWESNPSTLTSPFQSKFNKKADALYPFWEPNDTPNSSGDIVFGGTWTPYTRFPEIVKILIVTGGSVGTATYRIQIKKFVRMSTSTNSNQAVSNNNGNSWNLDKGETVPFLNPSNPHPKHHGQGIACPKTRWKGEQIVMYDRTGITLINLYDGTFTTWDSLSTPSLNVSEICQCETVPNENLMYVACRVTGLYRINVTSNTVTQLNNSPCYGVCVGGSGKIYAAFEGRISNSDNWATPLSITAAGINSGNTPEGTAPSWNRIRYIKANPWDTSDKLGIIINKTNGTNVFGNGASNQGYVVWWSPSATTGVVFNHTSGVDVITNPNAVNCHPSEDCWIIPAKCLAKWGQTSPFVSNITIPYSACWSSHNYNYQPPSDVDPLQAIKHAWSSWFGTPTTTVSLWPHFYYANFYKGYVVGLNELINPLTGAVHMSKSSTFIENPGNLYQGGSCISLDGDLFLHWGFDLKGHYQIANLFRTHATNGPQTQGWIDYGWNGTAWVEGSTTPRTTHASALSSPNGLTISFVEGNVPNITSFVAGQYTLQYMCHGLLIDNTINWYYEVNRYFTEYVTATFPVNFKVPSTSTNGVYEVTLPKYKKVSTNATYGWVDDGTTDGIDPDPNFYAADMQSKRSFNIALNGVSIPYTSIFYISEKPNPNPMEISIQYTDNASRTNCKVRFNAADAGKTITGTYVYMKCPV